MRVGLVARAEGYGRLEQALLALALEGIDPAPTIEAGIEQARQENRGEAKSEGVGAERLRANAAARAVDGGGDAVVPGVGREAGAGAGGAGGGAGAGGGGESGAIVGPPGLTPTITGVDLALRLLARNADRVAGVAGGRGRKARASAEETNAALIKQLDALARRIAVKAVKRIGGEVVEQGAIEQMAIEHGSIEQGSIEQGVTEHGGTGQGGVPGTPSE